MIHTGIVQYLSEIDTNIFLSFNGIHSPFWDYFMSSFTGKFIWIPMYATILYILLKNFHWKVVMCYVAAIALTITFADQMCSSIIRPVVARLRPANPENPIVDLVYIVNGYRGGSYGFPSCHAANSLGLAMFVIYCHMWIQSVVLEYHCDISVFWLYVIYYFVTDLQFSGSNIFQTGDHTECCRFTTSGWSYENDKFFIFNLKVEVFYCFKSIWISFVNVF